MKIVSVVGARPQFVKAATVSRALASRGIAETMIHTGQHYDANMSDVFFAELGIPAPAHHLGVGGGSHGAMTGQQLERIERVLLVENPDTVLVYGDTNSTLAGALAAAKLHIPVAHVEAGLRSFNRRMPEEINRVLTDHMSSLLFAPTATAVRNLADEGISGAAVHAVGDVMFDATLHYMARAKAPVWLSDVVEPGRGYVLCTVHRAENTDDPGRLRDILRGLAGTRTVILPLHPRTKAKLAEFGLAPPSNVVVVPPVGYLEMLWLEANCTAIATDSGGMQKEAYFHRKRCVTMRDETEWVELVDAGVNTLVGSDPRAIADALAACDGGDTDLFPTGIYGDGHAAEKIAALLAQPVRAGVA